MLIRILTDSYRFFDRRWLQIVMAALISLGIVEGIVLTLHQLMPDPAFVLKDVEGNSISMGYDNLLEPILLFLIKIWFDGFTALLLKNEIEEVPIVSKTIFAKSVSIYPRLLLISFLTNLAIFPSVAAAIMIMSIDKTGLMSLMPIITAFVLFVWFSLIIPVAVIDKPSTIITILKRSRYLVNKFFLLITAIIFVTLLPSFAMLDVADTSMLTHLTAVFIYFATMVMGSLSMLFAYVHLRVIKGEALVEQTRAAAEDTSQSE